MRDGDRWRYLCRLQHQAAAVAAAPPDHLLIEVARRELVAAARRLGLRVQKAEEVAGAVVAEIEVLEARRRALEAVEAEALEAERVKHERYLRAKQREKERRMARRAAG